MQTDQLDQSSNTGCKGEQHPQVQVFLKAWILGGWDEEEECQRTRRGLVLLVAYMLQSPPFVATNHFPIHSIILLSSPLHFTLALGFDQRGLLGLLAGCMLPLLSFVEQHNNAVTLYLHALLTNIVARNLWDLLGNGAVACSSARLGLFSYQNQKNSL